MGKINLFYKKSNLLINLFLDPLDGFFDSTDRQEIKFCVDGLIFMFFGAGRCSFMPILYLFMYFLYGGPIGVAPGTGVPFRIPGLGFPLGWLQVRASGALGCWDLPRLPGPLGPGPLGPP